MVAARHDAPGRAAGRVRRPVVSGSGEQLREQDREHDVAGGLRVGSAPARCAQGDQEQRAHVAGHGHIVPCGDDGRMPG